MNKNIMIYFLIAFFSSISGETPMNNTYFKWEQFSENFGREMASASSVFESMAQRGIKNYSLLIYDFTFISDKK